MFDFHVQAELSYSILNLKMASGVCRDDNIGAGGRDVVHLAFEKLHRVIESGYVVHAGAPAAPCRFRELDEFYPRNRLKNSPRLLGDFLCMNEMACFVVRNPDWTLPLQSLRCILPRV